MKFWSLILAISVVAIHIKHTAGESPSAVAEAPQPTNGQQENSVEYLLKELLKYKQQVLPEDDQEFTKQRSRDKVGKGNSQVSPLFPLLSNTTVDLAHDNKKDKKKIPSCYRSGKKVSLTQYWIPRENEWDETAKGNRIFLGGDIKRPLMDKNKKVLAQVPLILYDRCHMEGFCLLENGDLINLDNSTDAFIKVGSYGRVNNVFGLGSGEQNLVPFVSVAANDIPYGQTIYIPQLDGVELGEKQKHNGCVRVDDESWSFDSCQIDLFVNTYVDYLWLDVKDRASVEIKDCQIKNYVTTSHLSAVRASMNRKIIPNLLQAKYTEL